MSRVLLILAVLGLVAGRAEATGVIRGTVWSTRGESRRADAAREKQAKKPVARSVFDYMGTPALEIRRAPSVPRAGAVVPDPTPAPRITDVVISVRKIPESTERRLARPKPPVRGPEANWSLARSGGSPRVLVVTAGSRVQFHNDDGIWHRLFAVSLKDPLTIGPVRPGRSQSVTLDRPGAYPLLCALHSREFGYVVVTPNHAWARPDSLGRFSLPSLPPGRYELAIWDADHGTRRRTLEVPRGADVVCNLSF